MASILEFIQEETKSRHQTMSHLIDDNFSRSGFYRLMNEPHRITEEDIAKISYSLKLGKAKELELRNIIKQSVSGYSESEHNNLRNLLYTKPRFYHVPVSEVEFFSTDSSQNRTIKAYEDIIDNHLEFDKETNIKIRIYNCLSDSALSSLYSFLTKIRNYIVGKNLSNEMKIEIEHVITIGPIDNISKIALLLNIAHMIQFCHYSVYFTEHKGKESQRINDLSICEFLENTVLLRKVYGGQNNNTMNKYFLFKLSNIEGKRDYCFETDQRNYYGFYRGMFNSLKSDVIHKQSFFTIGAAKINEEIATYQKPFRKLLIKSEPCLDNIHPDIWQKMIGEALHDEPQKMNNFRNKIDSDNNLAFLDDNAFFEAQINFLETRFHENEHPGSINIYDVQGFTTFIKDGRTLETRDIPRISPELLKIQLLYMIKQVHLHYADKNYQQFYFFKKANATSNLFVNIFDNLGVCISYEKCIDIINSNLFFSDPEIAKLMYTVIENSLPSDEILSKEETLGFLKLQFQSLGGTKDEITDYISQN